MNFLSRHSDYAMQALCYLSGRDGFISVSEICSELGLPGAFTRGLLQKLAGGKYLHSVKGKNGGFKLAMAPDKITLIGVMQIFQGPFELTRCLFKKRPCAQQSTCKLKAKFKKIETLLLLQLKSTTIADLL